MQGRPRQSTKLLELKGAFKKNPARARARAQEGRDDRGVGDPPAEWKPDSYTGAKLLVIWQRLLEEAPPGCITWRQRTSLMNACRLQLEIEGGGKVTPAMHSVMHRYLTAFGMTGESRLPGRSEKDVPPGESEESGWEAFARQEKAPRAG
jgi:hypothetical protein